MFNLPHLSHKITNIISIVLVLTMLKLRLLKVNESSFAIVKVINSLF